MWFRRKKVEERATFQVDGGWLGPATMSGVNVSPDRALRLSAVWACIRILTDTISTLPYRTFYGDTLRPAPAPSLVVAPAAHTKFASWIAQIMRATLTTGDGWGLIAARGGAALRPTQIELVHPSRVSVQFAPDRMTRIYRFDGRQVVRDEELWRFPGYEYPGIAEGLSPVRYQAETIGLGIAAQGFGAAFFGNGATPSGLLITDGRLGDAEFDELTMRWQEQHQGPANAQRMALLEGGLTYERISVSPEEAQFLETQQFTVQQIAMTFGVPPEMIAASVAGTNITYANITDKPLDLLKFGVGPWLKRLHDELDDLLPGNIVGRFDPAGLLKADLKSRAEAYQIALADGWLTVDEIRALEELPPLPAGAPGAGRPNLEVVA
jgi:HK97 family phage portal protein